MPTKSATDKIKELKEQLVVAELEATQELRDREAKLLEQLEEVRAQIAEITGEEPRAQKAPKKKGKLVSSDRLKELLNAAPEKTLSLRKEGLDLDCVKKLAAEFPKEFQIAGKGPWPTVSLIHKK